MANIIYCPEKSIFEHDSNTWLVNPVNCVGVMGKGLALEFKKRYPNMFARYVKDCSCGYYELGEFQLYSPEKIIAFPTKKHWKDSSKLKDIISGVLNLLVSDVILDHPILAIALPKLGCGLGGLDWKEVHEYIRAFALLCPCETVYIHGENPRGVAPGC